MMVIASMIAGLGLLAAVGQDPTGPSTPVPDVVVTGTQQEMIRRYVDVLPDVNRRDEALARFDRQVCPGVVNMDAHAQRIVDRIAATAVATGLTVGAPGCSPNILVIFTTDGDRTAAELRRGAAVIFDEVARSRRSGRSQLNAFLESDAPVRWWQSTADEPSMAGIDLALITQNLERENPGPRPTYRSGGSSRTRPGSYMSSATQMDITMAVVIVDLSRTETVSLDAVADYAAFVALGQIDPEAETAGMDTVLNLFDPSAGRVAGMSEFDRAYLRALYAARGDAARASQQKSEIAAHMLQNMRR